MERTWILSSLGIVAIVSVAPALNWGGGWWALTGIGTALLLLAVFDLVQTRHSVLRMFPVIGHARFALERIRPELQQYFIERNFDGRPYDRDTRTVIYQRAKNIAGVTSFGTERTVDEVGYESLIHATVPVPEPDEPPRVAVGGPDCTRPYSMALLNVSAMSFGSLSPNAILALNGGAARGGFAHDSGEGGISRYHLEPGGDLIWELGTGYFGARTAYGMFDPAMFRDRAAIDTVKAVSLKLSQGAKPGKGGILPGAKVIPEIARVRDVPVGEDCVSPSYHRAFTTPRELVHFLAEMRTLADGKPVGFKLCVGSRVDVLAICKAMVAEGITPDFIVVDGAEGGTGAAPPEYQDHVGLPLTEGLMTVHDALVGCGLRDQIRIGASGKIATGSDIVKRLIQGADFTNAARAMMMAVGCIQTQLCHTNRCPTGVATQDPRRGRALHVPTKTDRVYHYQRNTVAEAVTLMASMGCATPSRLTHDMLMRRISPVEVRSYRELYQWLEPGELLVDPPRSWADDWVRAHPDSFV